MFSIQTVFIFVIYFTYLLNMTQIQENSKISVNYNVCKMTKPMELALRSRNKLFLGQTSGFQWGEGKEEGQVGIKNKLLRIK